MTNAAGARGHAPTVLIQPPTRQPLTVGDLLSALIDAPPAARVSVQGLPLNLVIKKLDDADPLVALVHEVRS